MSLEQLQRRNIKLSAVRIIGNTRYEKLLSNDSWFTENHKLFPKKQIDFMGQRVSIVDWDKQKTIAWADSVCDNLV